MSPRRSFLLLPLAALLAAGGCGSSGSKLSPSDRARLQQGVLAQEPGSKLAGTSCGSNSCTIYLRKPGSHQCDGYDAQLDSAGNVSALGVGHRSC